MVEMSLDGQHFTAILEQNRTWLLRWFTSRCGSPDIAEDLVQETSLEAWRNRHKFTVPGGERGWLATIGNHVFRRWQRTMGRSRVTKCQRIARTLVSNGLEAPPVLTTMQWMMSSNVRSLHHSSSSPVTNWRHRRGICCVIGITES